MLFWIWSGSLSFIIEKSEIKRRSIKSFMVILYKGEYWSDTFLARHIFCWWLEFDLENKFHPSKWPDWRPLAFKVDDCWQNVLNNNMMSWTKKKVHDRKRFGDIENIRWHPFSSSANLNWKKGCLHPCFWCYQDFYAGLEFLGEMFSLFGERSIWNSSKRHLYTASGR